MRAELIKLYGDQSSKSKSSSSSSSTLFDWTAAPTPSNGTDSPFASPVATKKASLTKTPTTTTTTTSSNESKATTATSADEVYRPNALRLLQRMIRGGEDDDKMDVRKRFKSITRVLNIDEANLRYPIRALGKRYNCKPFLIRTTSSFHQGANYFEIDIDVHRFSYPARYGLSGALERLKLVKFDFAFVVQGDPDEELPEQMLSAVRLSKLGLDVAPQFPIDVAAFEEATNITTTTTTTT
jgi:hypothetical protein